MQNDETMKHPVPIQVFYQSELISNVVLTLFYRRDVREQLTFSISF